MSEVKKCRSRLKDFCYGVCLDIGCGGDVIIPSAIAIDLENPYKKVGNRPIQLAGDCKNLYWFKDEVIDTIFSSHLLEDFMKNEQIEILNEWARVLKCGGKIILYLPDQKKYLNFCDENNMPSNPYHKSEDYSLDWFILNVLNEISNLKIVSCNPEVEDYSFEVILEKIKQ